MIENNQDINHNIKNNKKFPKFYGIINRDPAQLVIRIN